MQAQSTLTRHLADRAVIMVALAGLSLACVGAWLYAHDRPALEVETRLTAERALAHENLAKSQAQIEQLNGEIAGEQDKVVRSAKIVTDLEQLETTWSWFGGNRAQAKANAERLQEMKTFNATASARVLALRQELAKATWERDGHELALKRVDSHLQAEEARKASYAYYLERAWLRVRSWLIITAAVYVLGPVLVRLVLRKRAAQRALAS